MMIQDFLPKSGAVGLVTVTLLAGASVLAAAASGSFSMSAEDDEGVFEGSYSSYERQQEEFRLERAGLTKKHSPGLLDQHRRGGGLEAMQAFHRLRKTDLYLTPQRLIEKIIDEVPEGEVGSSDASGGGFSSKAKARSPGGSDFLPDISGEYAPESMAFFEGAPLSASSEEEIPQLELSLMPVPEPSAGLLALIGFMGSLMGRRRRG